MEPTADALRQRCEERVSRILAERRARLVTVAEQPAFIVEVFAEVLRRLPTNRTTPVDKLIERATVNRYCHLWYNACQDAETVRQAQAFEELYEYLYGVVASTYPALANPDEVAQQGVVAVWQSLPTVRDPGSFARLSAQIALRAAYHQWKKEERAPVVMSDNSPLDRDLPDSAPVPTSPSQQGGGPRMGEEARARRQQAIAAAIRRCLAGHSLRQDLIVGLFLEDKGLKELAALLKRTPNILSVEKGRAIGQLRGCEEVIYLLEDFVDGLEREG